MKFINDLKAGIITKSNFEVLNGDFTRNLYVKD